MLKFQALAEVGDRIRGYDFEFSKDYYIEGRVVAKGAIYHPTEGFYMYEAYSIEIDTDTMDGSGRVGDIGYVPFESSMDYDTRIELVKKVEEFA